MQTHCSIDNFYGPDDLDAIKAALADVASRNRPFDTSIGLNDLRGGWVLLAAHDDGAGYEARGAPTGRAEPGAAEPVRRYAL
ncbi:MAG: hypothetical protein CL724_03885 [Chloroflexi bacterium]|mgnify:CR=1 FL=1|jgi:hypothetical protein|nr:hypothetical protein [Chloroflexota bacterium]